MTSIKNELVGSWQLLSYIEISVDGSESLFPLGKKPNGILIYAADGYMSAQIFGRPDENPIEQSLFIDSARFASEHRSGQLIFSGAYHIDNRRAIVSHEVMASITPKLIGKTIQRNATFDADVLYLKSVTPVLSNGKMVNSYMTWQRMDKFEFQSRREKFIELTSSKTAKIA